MNNREDGQTVALDAETLRLDDLENGTVIWQDPSMFCFGIDAVLLAHYPRLAEGDRILDLGTGFAPVPLIMSVEAAKRGLSVRITGIEIQERAAEIARRSVAENGLEEQISVVRGDIREACELFGAASFSLVVSNPPYVPAEGGLVGANRAKAVARTELCCTLRDVTAAAGRLLVPGGRFAIIHRPFRLPELFGEMRSAGLEPKRMRLVYPYEDAEPTMVLAEGVRGGRPGLKTDPPLIIYRKDRNYTGEILRIYGKAPAGEADSEQPAAGV